MTDFPDYVLAKNQLPSRENIALFEAALHNSISGIHIHSTISILLKTKLMEVVEEVVVVVES